MKKIELTDEIRQDEPVGYLVFNANKNIGEYTLFVFEEVAKTFADEQKREEARMIDMEEPDEWSIYPLYASHPTEV